jgi:hypothetical protein
MCLRLSAAFVVRKILSTVFLLGNRLQLLALVGYTVRVLPPEIQEQPDQVPFRGPSTVQHFAGVMPLTADLFWILPAGFAHCVAYIERAL